MRTVTLNFRPRPSALKECVTADAYEVGTEMAGRAGYHGRRSRSSRSGTSSATVPAAVPPRRDAPPASVGLVTRLAHPVRIPSSWVPVPRRPIRIAGHTATVVSCSSRRRPVYSSQRRINYNINDVRRVSDVYCGDAARAVARAARACSFRTALVSLSESFTDTPMRIRVLAFRFRERDVETAAFCATFWPCSRLMPFASTTYAVDVASARRLF